MKLNRRLLSVALAVLISAIVGFAEAESAGAAPATVSTVPASYTPWLLASTPNQYVRDLVPCGDTMFAVGTISAVGQKWKTYTRSNAFSFSQTTGAVTSWAPQVNGQVNSIALSPDCSIAYLGGTFTSVNGSTATNIAAVDATTGALIGGFKHFANRAVMTLQYTHGALLVGGRFTKINGAARTLLASLNPTNGAATNYANLTFSGIYPKTVAQVYNSQVSHAGDRMLIEGVFTSIDGAPRQQMAVLDLGSSAVSLDGWTSSEFERACAPVESFYERAGAWSPDDATIYGAATGYKPASGPGSGTNDPRSGLCDSVAAFPSTNTGVSSTWINYTGCDSYYAVAADAANVYVAGHERWADNPNGCDYAGPGALSRPGIASMDPATGQATDWNPTRSLGHGADDMVLTNAGLWVASDNWTNGMAQKCGGVGKHGGICFLPY